MYTVIPGQHSSADTDFICYSLIPQVLEEDNQHLELKLLIAEEALSKLQQKLSALESARCAYRLGMHAMCCSMQCCSC